MYYREPLGRREQIVLATYADDIVVIAEIENGFKNRYNKKTDTNLIVAAKTIGLV